MGWAIKRGDGSYRGWNANAKDDTLRNGEVWEVLDAMPTITADPVDYKPLAKAEIDSLVLDGLELYFRACMLLILDQINAERNRHGVGPISPAQMWQAIKDKVDSL